MIKVFQIHFDPHSKQHLEPEFIPYENLEADDYFESMVMKNHHEMNPVLKEEIKYIGVSSWKQKLKTHLTAKEIIEHIQKDIDSDTAKDVYIYAPLPSMEISIASDGLPHATIKAPDIWNEHFYRNSFLERDNELINNSGVLPFNIHDGKWQYCKCNYWIAKREVFDEYCKTVLLPALRFYELPHIKAKMPRWYKHSHRGTMHNSACFTLEGLFGSFLAHSNYSFEYIAKKKRRSNYERIIIDGYERIDAQLLSEKKKSYHLA